MPDTVQGVTGCDGMWQQFKYNVKQWLEWFGILPKHIPDVLRKNPSRSAKLTWPQILKRFQLRMDDFCFIQIGAYDGLENDPVSAWVRQYQWRGVLLEPQERFYNKLCHNYRDQPQLNIVNKALAGGEESQTLYRIDCARDGLPAWAPQLASFNKDVLLSHADAIPDIRDLIVEESVACTTFSALIREFDLQRVNLLLIDTEGFDFEIIKMIPWDTITPDIIYFEHLHLSPADYEACCAQLVEKGYTLAIQKMDTVAFQKP